MKLRQEDLGSQLVTRRHHAGDYLAAPLDLRLTIPSVALWAALLACNGSPASFKARLALATALLAAVFALAAWVRQPRRKARRHRTYPTGSFLAAAALTALTLSLSFATQALHYELDSSDPAAAVDAGKPQRFEAFAQVISTPQPLSFGDSYRVDLRIHWVSFRRNTLKSRALVQVEGSGWEKISLGSWVRLRMALSRRDMSGQYLGFAKSPSQPHVYAPPSGRFRFVNSVRATLTRACSHLSDSTSATILAMTLGVKTAQSDTDKDAMRISGLAHLTAISGMHLGVVISLALALTSRARRCFQAGAALIILAIFVSMLEGSASIMRATLMGTVTLAGMALARPGRSLSALSTAMVAILLLEPWQASSWGFALSVTATASIVTLGNWMAIRFTAFLPRILAFPLAVSLAAQLGCAPLMLLLRGKLQVYSLPANLLTGAVSSVVTVGGLAMTALAALGSLGLPLEPLTWIITRIAGGAADWILAVARFFSRLPGAEIPWLHQPEFAIPGLLIVTLCWGWLTARLSETRLWRIGRPRGS